MTNVYGPLTLKQARKKVATLRELEDFYRNMAAKYGCNDRTYQNIKDISDQLEGLSNIQTMRPQDFIRFANGEFGFI